LLTAYTVYCNLRHSRHGHLFDGRFKAKLVEGDDYLQALSRYVHLNPVMVGGIKDKPLGERLRYLREYKWSTYPGYIGIGRRYEFVTYDPVLGEMGGKRRERPKRYRAYVETGLAETDKEFAEVMKSSPRSIGGENFRAWVNELYDKLVDEYKTAEDGAFRHVTESLDTETVIETVGRELGVKPEEFQCRRRDSVLRAVAAHFLLRYAGKSQRDVAMILKAGGGSAISKQLSKYRAAFNTGSLRAAIERIEERLIKERKRRCAKPVNS